MNTVTAARSSKIATPCKDAKRTALVLVCTGRLVSFAVRAFRKFLKCSDGLQRHIFSNDLHVTHD